jgi:hypothetical protein
MSACTRLWTEPEFAMVTIPGGKHGGFSDAEMARAYTEIRGFLDKLNIIRQTTN